LNTPISLATHLSQLWIEYPDFNFRFVMRR